jgi:uncharacterized membrane protein
MSPIILRKRFPQATLDAIEQAVAAGEKTHRGQVRFALEAELDTDELWRDVTSRERALEVFSFLNVWDTEENNGVLIYVLLADHKVEIVADRGIHKHVGNARWNAICREVELHYRKGDFQAGSVIAIEKISAELAHYFPRRGEQKNEQGDMPVVL